MKKIFTGVLLVLLIASFAACDFKGEEEGAPEPATANTMENTTIEEGYSVTEATSHIALPVYQPGSVNLKPKGYWEEEFDLPYEVEYRICYYSLPGWVEDLGNAIDPGAGDFATNEIAEKRDPNGPSEMTIVTYLKRVPIPKDVFEAELKKYIEIEKEIALLIGDDPADEFHELPNADIIYTFDNDIINEYYRRA